MKIALSLRGGGVNCIGYLGALKALEECGIKIDAIIASSAASVVGGAYALGMSIPEIEEISKQYTPLRFIGLDSIADGTLASNDMTIDFFKSYVGNVAIEQAQIPLYVQATNFKTLKNHVFESGPMAEVITASMSVPAIYHPVKIDNEYYYDGDVSSGFGVEFLNQKGFDFVIGFTVSKFPIQDFSAASDTALGKFFTPMFISISNLKQLDQQLFPVDFMFDDLGGDLNPVLDAAKAYTLINSSYQTTMARIPLLKNKIKRKQNVFLNIASKIFG